LGQIKEDEKKKLEEKRSKTGAARKKERR